MVQGGGYYRVAVDTGPIPTQNQFPCRTLVAGLDSPASDGPGCNAVVWLPALVRPLSLVALDPTIVGSSPAAVHIGPMLRAPRGDGGRLRAPPAARPLPHLHVTTRRAASAHQVTHDQDELGPTEADMGRGWFLLSSGFDRSGYY